MLIIQIALGIVLALILLALLPQILSMTIWIGMAAVAIVIVVLAAQFISEFLPVIWPVIMSAIILLYLVALIYSAINWKSILRTQKIDELNIEKSNLQQMLSIVERADHDAKDLKANLSSKQNLRAKIKEKQAQLEKLAANDKPI